MRQQRGFTIMELIIAIAVLAIVLGLAVPNFQTFISNNKLSGQTNEMITAFQVARSEALRRGAPVRVCSSSDSAACGGDWNEGWIVIFDEGGTDEEVLRVWGSPGDDFEFTPASGSGSFLASGCFDHNDNGRCSAPASGELVKLDLDGCSTDNVRQILVTPGGRVASEREACS